MIGGLVAYAHSLWRGGRAGDALQRERDAVAALSDIPEHYLATSTRAADRPAACCKSGIVDGRRAFVRGARGALLAARTTESMARRGVRGGRRTSAVDWPAHLLRTPANAGRANAARIEAYGSLARDGASVNPASAQSLCQTSSDTGRRM